jgi:hypothetical protein
LVVAVLVLPQTEMGPLVEHPLLVVYFQSAVAPVELVAEVGMVARLRALAAVAVLELTK